MKKTAALILSICLAAAGLTGCQGGKTAESTQAAAQAAETEAEKNESETEAEKNESETEADNGGTVTIVDHGGNEVQVPKNIERIVVTDIFPLPSVISVFLDSAEKIVGMSPVSMSAAKTGLLGELYPEILNAETGFIDGTDVNIEELMKLEPDVVFYNAGSKEQGETLRSAGLAAVGFSVNKWEYNSIETYNQWTALLSELFPEEGDRAEKVSEYSQKIYDDIQERVSGLSDEERRDILFLFNYSDTTMITSGKRFFGQFWCEAVGGRNVAEEVAAENSNAVINMEQVYQWDPDVIFITNFTPTQPEDLFENAVGQDDWSPVKAVQNKEVYKLPLGTYRSYTPSTDTPVTLLWMAQKVYPELFEDIDIIQEVKNYYKEAYGVELTDEQVDRMYNPGRGASEGFKK